MTFCNETRGRPSTCNALFTQLDVIVRVDMIVICQDITTRSAIYYHSYARHAPVTVSGPVRRDVIESRARRDIVARCST